MEFQTVTPPDGPPDVSFPHRVAAMSTFGVLGLVGLAVTSALQLVVDPSIAERSGLAADASLPVAVASSVAMPAVLVVVATVVGTACASRVGFCSLVHDHLVDGSPVWRQLRERAPRAVAVGIATGVVLVALDALLTAVVPGAAAATSPDGGLALVAASAPARFLFGGVAEEIMLRWGLVSVLAWALNIVVPGDRQRVVAWTAVALAALAFGAAHLPAAAASTELTAPLIARVVALNAFAGVVFGWLYVSDAVETAMVAHASAHVPLLATALVGAI